MGRSSPATTAAFLLLGSVALVTGCAYIGIFVGVLIQAEGGVEEVCKETVTTEMFDSCVAVGTECCAVEVCGIEADPNQIFNVHCGAVVLVEWDDDIDLVSATWSSPGQLTTGNILIEPAENFALPFGLGPIVTDPGYSAYVLRLDAESLAPTPIDVAFEFEITAVPENCVKWLWIATLEPVPPGSSPRFIAPIDGPGLDFTVFHAPDPQVLCEDSPVPVDGVSWGRIKIDFLDD